MQTLELGYVNAGFIFFCIAILSTFVFGRFFCGWGCHIVALQDLCGWIMKKFGVHPKPFRSRLLVFAPLALAVYMFVWPTFERLALVPVLRRISPDLAAGFRARVWPDDGFTNHLLTEDFWSTFATIGVAIPFLLICGFATVYFLGAKGFCTYGCPYGGFFAPVDSVSLGKIVVDHDKCHQCGHCTAVCTSNVRVHDEIREFGMVVDPGCMKCMDCVSVCPNTALSFAFSKPSILKGKPRNARPVRHYDATLREELFLGVTGLCTFFAVRGIYNLVPMLMAVGVAACTTFLVWKLWRLVVTPNVRLVRFQLRLKGRIRPAGVVFVFAMALLLILIAHSGYVNYHRWRGDRMFNRAAVPLGVLLHPQPYEIPAAQLAMAERAHAHLKKARSWRDGGHALLATPATELAFAHASLMIGDVDAAIEVLSELARRDLAGDRLSADLGRLLDKSGRRAEAIEFLRGRIAQHPDYWESLQDLAYLFEHQGELQSGIEFVRETISALPQKGESHRLPLARAQLALGRLLEASDDRTNALEAYQAAVKALPDSSITHENLAAALARLSSDLPAAADALKRAAELNPEEPRIWFYLGQLYFRMNQIEDAERAWRESVKWQRDPAALKETIQTVSHIYAISGMTADADRWIRALEQSEGDETPIGPSKP